MLKLLLAEALALAEEEAAGAEDAGAEVWPDEEVEELEAAGALAAGALELLADEEPDEAGGEEVEDELPQAATPARSAITPMNVVAVETNRRIFLHSSCLSRPGTSIGPPRSWVPWWWTPLTLLWS